MWRIPWLLLWMFILLLIGTGCAALKTTFGIGLEKVQAGDIGGGGDSVSLWLAISGLTLISVLAYPAQRSARLLWNSWRGKLGIHSKGRETCIKHLEWE